MVDNITIGDKISFFRRKAGFTQNEIAEKLGVSRSLVGQIEKDLTRPNLDFLSGFTKLVNISYAEILDNEGIANTVKALADSYHKPELSPSALESELSKHNSKVILASPIYKDIQKYLLSINELYFHLLDSIMDSVTIDLFNENLKGILTSRFIDKAVIRKHLNREVLTREMIEDLIDLYIQSRGKGN